jgi:Tfp pilus assembly protein PilO
MAEPKLESKLPRQSVIYLVLGLLIIGLVGVALILPANIKMHRLDAKAEEVKFKIQEQRILLPIQQTLKKQSEQKVSEMLPLPQPGRLEKARIGTIPASFIASAKASGMSLTEARPDLGALTGNAQVLPVDVVLKGDFLNLRKFLIALGGMPYVQRIDQISIQEMPDTKEFRLKVWVAVG